MFYESIALTNILLACLATLSTAICIALWRIMYRVPGKISGEAPALQKLQEQVRERPALRAVNEAQVYANNAEKKGPQIEVREKPQEKVRVPVSSDNKTI
jgi:hypothetical protein